MTESADNSGERVIVIGASAGGVAALNTILPKLPQDFPFAILVVVHLPPDQPSLMAEIFRSKCALKVKEGEDKELLLPGTVYFAPPNYHMLIESGGYISLSSDEAVLLSRPSIDVLFESAADAFEERAIGIILTGASSDGAAGLQMVCRYGGQAFIQDPQTAEASVMPSSAKEACSEAEVLSLERIKERLLSFTKSS